MLYDLEWLAPQQSFPPAIEVERIERYKKNALLFQGEALSTRHIYQGYISRVERVVGNFEDFISFPVVLNYQRLMTLKMADLVCGEYPTITGTSPEQNDAIKDLRDYTNFDEKLYSTVIDISRFGEGIWRIYKSPNPPHNLTFTCWSPLEWFPIVSQDGTNTIIAHVLTWLENISTDPTIPRWNLVAQTHYDGYYIKQRFQFEPNYSVGLVDPRLQSLPVVNATGIIGNLLSAETVQTGLKTNAVFQVRAFRTTDTVYGYDDYLQIDSIVAELLTRIAQISNILDKHADPSMAGPVSMLKPIMNENGALSYVLEKGKFWAISPNELPPQYLTWDGQLTAAFQQVELLINELHTLSELGAALLGATDKGSGQAVSGTAMRFKMVNPLAKARRVSNSLTRPVRQLFAMLSQSTSTPLELKDISTDWADGLPDDPREQIELIRLATGETKIMPLEEAIVRYFNRSSEEAQSWIEAIDQRVDERSPIPNSSPAQHPNTKGSQTSISNFKSPKNQRQD